MTGNLAWTRVATLAIVLTGALLVAFALTATVNPALGGPSRVVEDPATRTQSGEETDVRIAVLPLTNRSGQIAPLQEIREEVIFRMESHRGIYLLDDDVLDEFMERHRWRYTGGLNRRISELLKDETGSAAVLITSLDLYREKNPPKIGLTARLVATGKEPRILWMASVSRSGDQSPGVADTGLIFDIQELLEIVSSDLARSVPREATTIPAAEGEIPVPKRKVRWRFRPKIFYHSSEFPVVSDRAGRAVVLPFANDSVAPYAGEIMRDQIILHLLDAGVNVVEPGIVRQAMLAARQIYREGPSRPEMDILKVDLLANVVLFGEVDQYSETGPGIPRPTVDFSFKAISTASQQVVWASVSHSRGSDGVAFFDVGKVATAQRLAWEMAQTLVATARLEGPKPEKKSKRR